MKKKIVFAILLFCFFFSIFPETNPWGELKKIYFYDSIKNYDQVLKSLNAIDISMVKRSDKKEIASSFINLGDHYVSLKKYDMAEIFYKRVLEISPNYWYVYNKLEDISRKKGSFLFNFKNTFPQLSMILKDFEASYLLFNGFFNMLLYASLLVLFIMALLEFIHYFNLAGNDLLIEQGTHFSIMKIIFMVLMMLWPIIIFSGWAIYPFLIIGFLWKYLSEKEKKSVVFLIIMIVIGSVLYSFNLVIKIHYQKDSFKIIKQVFEGHLFKKIDYEKFDPEMKVLQAFSYYEQDQLKVAEDILRSTGESYRNKSKYILLGNIYYKFENISESIKYFQMALSLDDSSDIALNNFTMVLLKNNNPEVFKSWAKRYTEIDEYKNNVLHLKEIQLSQTFLWRRLINLNGPRFNLWNLSGNILKNFLTLPIIYCLFIFMIYILLIPRLFPPLGKSTYCSKCSKIIKEASVHRSYKLCNDCYQLFMIKDVIFLEAKIVKEKELAKRSRKKTFFILLLSFIVPGLKLMYTNQQRRFIIFSGLFYFLMGYFLVNYFVMKKVFLTLPVFIHFIGGFAILLYFILNVYALRGDEDGI
jgi:tetratricopeptide (TPR) repeat protein